MYIYTRTARLAPGRNRDAMTWALGITEQVRHVTDLDISLWTTLFSPKIGQLTWSAVIEDLSQLEAANGKLATEERFLAEVDHGAAFITGEGVDDRVAQLVRFNPDPNFRPQYAAIVQAVMANGSLGRGIEVGVEIAERATKLSGVETAFVVGSTGAYGSVAWLTGAESLQELEAAEHAVNTDADFVAFLDREAGEVYLPGAEQSIVQRLF